MITLQGRFMREEPARVRALAASALGVFLFFAATSHTADAAAAARPGKAYIGVFKDNAVAVMDTGTGRVMKTIPVPPGPHGIVATPDGRKVYVSSDGASTVSIIDTAADRVAGSIEVGPMPHGLAISPDGRTVLASGFGTNQAVIIDTGDDRVVGRIPVSQPHNSAIAPDGRTAYVASQRQGEAALVILDLARRAEVGRLPLDKTPRALSVSPDGKQLYFTVAGEDAVQVLDTAGNRVVGRIPVGASPHFPLFTPDGKSGLVVSQGPGTLEILDPGAGRVRGTVKVGTAPHWIATSRDGRIAYVTNERSNDVSIVDLERREVTATIPVGNAPRKIALAPGGEQAGVSAIDDPKTRDVTGLAELSLEADDYYFEPAVLQGKPSQKLRLTVENHSGTLHNIALPDLAIDRDIPPKGKAVIDITFPRSGAVRFFCKFHAALGMKGELRAGDASPGGAPASR